MQNQLKDMLTQEEIKTISRMAIGKLSLKAQFKLILDKIVEQGLSEDRAKEVMIQSLAITKEQFGKSTALDSAGKFRFIDTLGKEFNGDSETLKNMEFFLESLLNSSDKLNNVVEQDIFRHIVSNYDISELDDDEQDALVTFKINIDKSKISSIPSLI